MVTLATVAEHTRTAIMLEGTSIVRMNINLAIYKHLIGGT